MDFNTFPVCLQVAEDPDVGRHVAANADLPEWQVALVEKPLIRGPSQFTGPVCLGCLKPVTAETATACAKCGWPMCADPECQDDQWHRAECDWTVERRGRKVSRRGR